MIDISNLSCPITGLVMADPVDTADGYTYEREAIEKWLIKNDSSPLTSRPLETKELRSNNALKNVIHDFLLKNKNIFEQNEVYLPERLLKEVYEDIIFKNLNSIKFKLTTLIDYRYFTTELNQTGYSAFYLASEIASKEITQEIFDYLSKNGLLKKIGKQPIEWRPVYLKGLIAQFFINELNTMNTKKITDLIVSFDANIRQLDPFYLINLAHMSAKHNPGLLKWLLEIGKIGIESKDENENTPILISAIHNNQTLFELLMEMGADLTVSNRQNENCFYHSIRNQNLYILKLILNENKLFKLKKLTLIEFTPLQLAIEFYPNEFCLYEKIIDLNESYLNLEDKAKRSALFLACEQNDTSLVEFLIKKKHLDVNQTNLKNENCLHIAARNKNTEIAEMLVKNGVDMNLKNVSDQTPIKVGGKKMKQFLNEKREEIFKNLYKENNELKTRNFKIEQKFKFLRTLNNLEKRNTFLAIGNTDGSINILNLDTAKCVKNLIGHEANVLGLELMINGALISCSSDRTIKIWDIESSLCLQTLSDTNNQFFAIILVSDRLLACGCEDSSIKIWALDTFEVKKILIGHSDIVQCFQLMKNGSLISGSSDTTIKIWNVSSGLCSRTLKGHVGQVCVLKVFDKKLLSGSKDKTVKVWNLINGECLQSLGLETRFIKETCDFKLYDMVLLSNNYIACACNSVEDNILIYNLENGVFIKALKGHCSGVLRLRLLMNGNLVSTSIDGTIKIWSLENLNCIQTLKKMDQMFFLFVWFPSQSWILKTFR